MAAPLDGIRVIEVSNWIAAPAATAMMADLGAEVIKIEPPAGDVFRGFPLASLGYRHAFPTNYVFQLDNRGKRSMTVDLDKPGGPELVKQLAATADIFVTNLVQKRRVRYGLTVEAVHAANPKAVYVSFSGYGAHGPDEDRPGFDLAAFWARSGVMSLIGEPDAPPTQCRGGQGDHTTSINLLAATLAALRMRDNTGEGQHVEVTLQATGMWTIAGDYAAALMAQHQPPRVSRKNPTTPMWNTYQCSDGLWILLVNPVITAWPKFCSALGRPEWGADPAYGDIMKLVAASSALTAECEAIFATKTRADWGAAFDAEGLIWAPVATMPDMLADPQVAEMGWVTEVESPLYGNFKTLNTPFKLYGTDTGVRGPAPEAGEHTFDVLAELGIEGEALDRLATAGVLG